MFSTNTFIDFLQDFLPYLAHRLPWYGILLGIICFAALLLPPLLLRNPKIGFFQRLVMLIIGFGLGAALLGFGYHLWSDELAFPILEITPIVTSKNPQGIYEIKILLNDSTDALFYSNGYQQPIGNTPYDYEKQNYDYVVVSKEVGNSLQAGNLLIKPAHSLMWKNQTSLNSLKNQNGSSVLISKFVVGGLIALTFFLGISLILARKISKSFQRTDPAASAAPNKILSLPELNDALRLDPKNADLYLKRATLNDLAEHYQEAYEDLSECLKLNPHNDTIFIKRGLVLERLGRYDEALKDFDAAETIAPSPILSKCRLHVQKQKKCNSQTE